MRRRLATRMALVAAVLMVSSAPAYGGTQGAGVQTCAVPSSINAPVHLVAGGPNDATGSEDVSPPENTYGANQGLKVVNVDHPSEVGQSTSLGPPQEGHAINCQPVPGSEPRGSF